MVAETRVQEATSWALAEFQNTKEYEDELIDASADVYQLKFLKCKKQVCRHVLKIDLSSIQINEESSKSGDEEVEVEEDRPQLTS